jgi:hypothetical protein
MWVKFALEFYVDDLEIYVDNRKVMTTKSWKIRTKRNIVSELGTSPQFHSQLMFQHNRVMNFDDLVSTLFGHQHKFLDHQHKILRRI